MKLRPSHINKYDDCPRAYYLQYVLGLKSIATSANLIFGTVVHSAITQWLTALAKGQDFDLVAAFTHDWTVAREKTVIAYNSLVNGDDLAATGQALVSAFPQVWREAQLVPLITEDGPIIERTFEAHLGGGLILTGTPDIVAMNLMGEVVVVDAKTPSNPSQAGFEDKAEQLTAYQILLEANRQSLRIDNVAGAGFMELVKRKVTPKGKGPQVLPPLIGRSRSEKEKAEYRQKVIWIAEDIQRGRFPKRPRMAYNTPCDLCEFDNLCSNGSMEGLCAPDQKQLAMVANL